MGGQSCPAMLHFGRTGPICFLVAFVPQPMQPSRAGESNRSSIMSVTWTISVGGRSYGPYSLEQMKAFQGEGRLAPHSLVVREGEEQMRYASEDGELAPLFPAPREAQATASVRQAEPGPARFGRD